MSSSYLTFYLRYNLNITLYKYLYWSCHCLTIRSLLWKKQKLHFFNDRGWIVGWLKKHSPNVQSLIDSLKTIYMVWSPGAVSVTFHNVIVLQCYSIHFITLLARYTEVKYQLKQSFFSELFNLTNCWVNLAMFYKKILT